MLSQKICIITDLDGTFLPKSKIPLPQDLSAVRRFEEAGGIFTIATGRTIQSSERYPEQMGLKSPMIVFNGGAIYDPIEKKVLFSHPLPDSAKEMTKKIISENLHSGCEVLCLEDTWVINNTEYEKEHIRICGVIPQYGTIAEVSGTWLKVLFAMNANDIPAFIEYIDNQHFEGVDFVRSERRFYEMLPSGVSKGSALTVYRHLSGMEGFQIIAVGDFDNDIEMLQASDFAVCPANAVDNVKQCADLILSRTCEEGAMEELIDKILKGDLIL
ncbi:MAG: HAD-IIB family hydrolase [Oscillospiraceae bacterium]